MSPVSMGVTRCLSWSVRDQVRALGRVRLEQPVVERAGEQGVVDAEEDVALRVVLGQDGLVDGLPGVAVLEDADLVAGLLLEVLQHALRHEPRVVADERDGLRIARAGGAGRAARGQHGQRDETEPDGHDREPPAAGGGAHWIPPG
jgi:hypothetical protein